MFNSSHYCHLYQQAGHPDPHSFPTRRSSDLDADRQLGRHRQREQAEAAVVAGGGGGAGRRNDLDVGAEDRKSTRLNSSHSQISYAVFCLIKKDIIAGLVIEPVDLAGVVLAYS